DALTMLTETERDAGQNADLLSVIGRAYRHAGDDRKALDYFTRAKSLAPGDPDIVSGFEATARAYGHSLAFEGYGEDADPGAAAASGTVALSVRATERLHLEGYARMKRQSGSSDFVGGGGALWRAGRMTFLHVRAVGGPDNTTLPTTDVLADVLHYAG